MDEADPHLSTASLAQPSSKPKSTSVIRSLSQREQGPPSSAAKAAAPACDYHASINPGEELERAMGVKPT
jgi:hypothetical protein